MRFEKHPPGLREGPADAFSIAATSEDGVKEAFEIERPSSDGKKRFLESKGRLEMGMKRFLRSKGRLEMEKKRFLESKGRQAMRVKRFLESKGRRAMEKRGFWNRKAVERWKKEVFGIERPSNDGKKRFLRSRSASVMAQTFWTTRRRRENHTLVKETRPKIDLRPAWIVQGISSGRNVVVNEPRSCA